MKNIYGFGSGARCIYSAPTRDGIIYIISFAVRIGK